MNTKRYIYLIILVFFYMGTYAQDKFNLQYSIATPIGDSRDYIKPTSWRGLLFEYEHSIQPKIDIGIQTGWHTFYEEKARSTYSLNDGSITSKQFRYLNSIPIMITGKYYFAEANSTLKPFCGIGIGTNHLTERTDNGLYTTKYKNWTFALKPEIGTLIYLTDYSNIILSIDYNNTFKASDITQQSWLNFNIGFNWIL